MNNNLNNISPVDGRYANKTKNLNKYFSEAGLIKYRIYIEIQYFINLHKMNIPSLRKLTKQNITDIQNIYENIQEKDIQRVKDIEEITNHDVKAVEYFIKEKFNKLDLDNYKEFIHFGLTSQDINNTATPLLLKDGLHNVLIPTIEELIDTLNKVSSEWQDISMLARTHGQAASPTKLGKEISVFIIRIKEQLNQLINIPNSAKFGGATGNLNAHYIAYPKYDWHKFSNEFLQNLGLNRSYPTTQIEHYDNLAAQFDTLKRINTILIDFSRDMWLYISMNYFNQKVNKNEVGSSAMPHKINPIDFENSEGNLGLANSLFSHFSNKLPISRLQRDLSDSTVLRNIGVPISHSLIAYKALIKGVNKLTVNRLVILNDLNNNWAVVAEAIQTILRREGIENPYEQLKDLTRNNEKIQAQDIYNFIQSLEISNKLKKELHTINPENYTGKA